MRSIIAFSFIILIQIVAKPQTDSITDKELQQQIQNVSIIQWQSSAMIDSLNQKFLKLDERVSHLQNQNDGAIMSLNNSIGNLSSDFSSLDSSVLSAQNSLYRSNVINRGILAVLFVLLIVVVLIGYIFIRNIKQKLEENIKIFQQLLESYKLELLDRINQLQHNQQIEIAEIRNQVESIEHSNSVQINKMKAKLKKIKKEAQAEMNRINSGIEDIAVKIVKKNDKIKTAIKEARNDMNERMTIHQKTIAEEIKFVQRQLVEAQKKNEQSEKKRHENANKKVTKKIKLNKV